MIEVGRDWLTTQAANAVPPPAGGGGLPFNGACSDAGGFE